MKTTVTKLTQNQINAHKLANDSESPAVYCGTYGKYNSGSLAGIWIDMTSFGSYSEFMQFCRDYHCDEVDPEIMLQDSQNMPDGLAIMESMSETEYNDILAAWRESQQEQQNSKYTLIDYSEKAVALIGDTKAIKEQLKAIGGRFNPRLSCGAGWIFPKKQIDALQSIIKGEAGELSTNSQNADRSKENKYKNILAEYLEQCADNWHRDFAKKYKIGAVKIAGKYCLIGKDTIETKFCWADEGEDYQEYKHITGTDENLARYFIAANLAPIERLINQLNDLQRKFYAGTQRENECYIYSPCYNWEDKNKPEDIELTAEERKTYLEATQWRYESFKNRLNAYLKRYGTSKLHTWTYWRDA